MFIAKMLNQIQSRQSRSVNTLHICLLRIYPKENASSILMKAQSIKHVIFVRDGEGSVKNCFHRVARVSTAITSSLLLRAMDTYGSRSIMGKTTPSLFGISSWIYVWDSKRQIPNGESILYSNWTMLNSISPIGLQTNWLAFRSLSCILGHIPMMEVQ